MLDKVLLISVSLTPLKMNCHFHNESLLRNFSSTPSHTATDLKGAPKGTLNR